MQSTGNLKAIAMATFGLDALLQKIYLVLMKLQAHCHSQSERQNAAKIIENAVF